MKPVFVFLFLIISSVAYSQTDSSLVKFINPPSIATPKGYSHVAEIDLGNCRMIIMSGQVALDKQGNLVGKNDMGKQAEQIFTNIKNIVEERGGKMDNLVKINIYILDASQVQAVRNIRDKFVNVKSPPASTLVQVSKLFREDILLEIEGTAIIAK